MLTVKRLIGVALEVNLTGCAFIHYELNCKVTNSGFENQEKSHHGNHM